MNYEYTIRKAIARCSLCGGKVYKEDDGAKCSNCGAREKNYLPVMEMESPAKPQINEDESFLVSCWRSDCDLFLVG